MNKSKPPSLISQDKAVDNYLTSLLTPAQVAVDKPTDALAYKDPVSEKTEKVSELLANMPVRVQTEVKPTIKPATKTPVAMASVKPIAVSQPLPETPISSAPKVKEYIPQTGTPDWCGRGFQALFFDVGGLTLAVPLIQLGGIHLIDKVTPLFGKPDWFKGLIHREQGETIYMVDTAKWVMPEKYDSIADKLEYEYTILLENTCWGLACNKVSEAIQLTDDDVKWRESVGKRPWLRGIVKDRKCALLDVDSLVVMLAAEDKKHSG